MEKKEFLLLIDSICDVDPGTVCSNDSLRNDSLFDSLAMIGLLAMLDKKFGIDLNMDDLKNIDTVGDLFCKVVELLK